MDTGQFASVLDILYSDNMTVYPLESQTASDGTTNNVISQTVKASAKCRVSYRKIDTPYENDEKGEPITFEVKVFCHPSVQVNAGDYIVIVRNDSGAELTVMNGYAGHPAQYGTHKEIILIHKGRA